MKRLKKIKLNEFAEVLDEQAMKVIVGGVTYNCIRLKNDGTGWGQFSTDNATIAELWEDAWNANSDWKALCNPSGYGYMYV